MNMVRIALLGITGVMLALQFKGEREEYGTYISIAASLLIFSFVTEKLAVFVKTAGRIGDFVKVDTGYLAAILKMTGITYAAEFTSGLCRDAGYEAIAVQVGIFAKLSIFILGLPILLALLETVTEFLR